MISEATPIECTLDLNARRHPRDDEGLGRGQRESTPELKDQLRKLLGIHKSLVDLVQEQDSLRRRLADYRGRMDDLHGQIVTLQAGQDRRRPDGHLKTQDEGDLGPRAKKTTIQIVDQEEKIMLSRVRFQDALAELTLPDAMQAAHPAGHAAVATPALSAPKKH